ncbi:MAG: hypothetical protein JEY71_09305 [Sphaerochaeta sp.]|nr:hypothetical protein [Sphaerochaeta sp.]
MKTNQGETDLTEMLANLQPILSEERYVYCFRDYQHLMDFPVWASIHQRSESSGSITMVPLPSKCRESKVRYVSPLARERRQRLLFPGLALGY